MKLAVKFVRLFCFVFLFSCIISGCKPKEGKYIYRYQDTDHNQEQDTPKNSVIDIRHQQDSKAQTYDAYIMRFGEVIEKKKIDVVVSNVGELRDIITRLLDQIFEYTGCDIHINTIHIKQNDIWIDIKKDSPLFDKELFDREYIAVDFYGSYEEFVYGTLDSIMKTLNENIGSDFNVIYTRDKEPLVIHELALPIDLLEGEPYQGYTYYKNEFSNCGEASIIKDLSFGMPYNNVLAYLNEKEISFTQKEEFSMLGDHEKWETYHDVNEYLRNAWTKIELSSDSYEFVFDYKECKLATIRVVNPRIASYRGLHVNDTVKELIKLYGTDYTNYRMLGSVIYEYQFKDCYFRVHSDQDKKNIKSYEVSDYSYAQIVKGQEIIEQIKYKQMQ